MEFTKSSLCSFTVIVIVLLAEFANSQDSYRLYMTKVYIKNACNKEGHSNLNHCLKCIMKTFKGAKDLQQEIGLCLTPPFKTIQDCFQDRKQGKEIEGCLIDKQQRINCYGIAARKITDNNFEETKIRNGIIKCQAPDQEDFLECMEINAIAPKIFSETFHRCQIGKVTRSCLHREYSGIEVDHFSSAMKMCPGVIGLQSCLHENLKDFPKCFVKIEKAAQPEN